MPGSCMPASPSLRLIDGWGRPSRCRRETPAVLSPVRYWRPGPPVGLDGGACILFEREAGEAFFLAFAARYPSREVGGCARPRQMMPSPVERPFRRRLNPLVFHANHLPFSPMASSQPVTAGLTVPAYCRVVWTREGKKPSESEGVQGVEKRLGGM